MLAYSTTTYSREDAIASRLKIAMRMLCYGGAVDGLSGLLGQYAACLMLMIWARELYVASLRRVMHLLVYLIHFKIDNVSEGREN